MTDNKISLRDAFSEFDSSLDNPASPKRKELDESLKADFPGMVELLASQTDLVKKIAELLDIDLPPLLMRFWEGAEEIGKALEESEGKPQEPVTLGLAEHNVEGTLRPTIEVRIGLGPSIKSYEIRFTLVLECKLTGIELRIRNGAIRGIELGYCEVKGTLKHGELELARAPRKGHGRFRFGPGESLVVENAGQD